MVESKNQQLWQKILKSSGRIGEKLAYYAFLLYEVAQSKDIPKSSKMIVVGALSYLILPIDLIPDFIPAVGFIDDSAVVFAAVYKIYSHIDESMKLRAKNQVQAIFDGE